MGPSAPSSSAAVGIAQSIRRRRPRLSKLLLDAIPQLRTQFALHASSNDNIFPLLSPPQHARVLSQWKIPPLNKPAAVLVPLVLYQGQPAILFTKRASHLSRHASEISFPGGHAEEGDATLIDTAVREAIEELSPTLLTKTNRHDDDDLDDDDDDDLDDIDDGTIQQMNDDQQQLLQEQEQQVKIQNIESNKWSFHSSSPTVSSSSSLSSPLEILGYATTLPSKRYMPVTPVVAVYPMELRTACELQEIFPGNPQEVDRVFCLSVEELLHLEATQASSVSRRLATQQGPMYVSPDYGTIWGLTAYILQPLLHQLFQPVFLPEWKKTQTETTTTTTTSTTANK